MALALVCAALCASRRRCNQSSTAARALRSWALVAVMGSHTFNTRLIYLSVGLVKEQKAARPRWIAIECLSGAVLAAYSDGRRTGARDLA